jgi:hypothetical protein
MDVREINFTGMSADCDSFKIIIIIIIIILTANVFYPVAVVLQ